MKKMDDSLKKLRSALLFLINPVNWLIPKGISGKCHIVHRIGGGDVNNLKLQPLEKQLNPPGISVLCGKSAYEASKQMKKAFPNATRLHEKAKIVGSAQLDDIKAIGFDVMPDPAKKFPNHGRLIHPEDVSGFNDINLAKLSQVFKNKYIS